MPEIKPAIGSASDAIAIPMQSGSATRKTIMPEMKSFAIVFGVSLNSLAIFMYRFQNTNQKERQDLQLATSPATGVNRWLSMSLLKQFYHLLNLCRDGEPLAILGLAKRTMQLIAICLSKNSFCITGADTARR